MRLDRFLSNAGYGSRKEVKQLLRASRVRVDGRKNVFDALHIDEYLDAVYVDDKRVEYRLYHYLLLHKPKGYVSATKPEGRYPPVTDLVSDFDYAKLFPVGRLDVDTTGVLLLTNHGTLAHLLLSPKHHVEKCYQVTVDAPLKDLSKFFLEGMLIDGEMTLPAQYCQTGTYTAEVVLHEGKFHQVKRMFLACGYQVTQLHRSCFDLLTVDDLAIGTYRLLTVEEISRLERHLKS